MAENKVKKPAAKVLTSPSTSRSSAPPEDHASVAIVQPVPAIYAGCNPPTSVERAPLNTARPTPANSTKSASNNLANIAPDFPSKALTSLPRSMQGMRVDTEALTKPSTPPKLDGVMSINDGNLKTTCQNYVVKKRMKRHS